MKKPERHNDQRHGYHKDGFVLLLILALLTFAVIVSASLARRSLTLAARVRIRERQIQERWAVWSAGQSCLNRADRLLNRQADFPPAEAPLVVLEMALQEIRIRIYINDLDASVNLNTVLREANTTGVRRLLTSAAGKSGMRTGRMPKAGEVLDSWGQLFDLAPFGQPLDVAATIPRLQQHVTCWGSGQLNLRRCTDENLHQLGAALGRTGLFDRVIRERSKNNAVQLDRIISEAATNDADESLLRRTLRRNSGGCSVLVTTNAGHAPLLLIHETGYGDYSDRRTAFVFD